MKKVKFTSLVAFKIFNIINFSLENFLIFSIPVLINNLSISLGPSHFQKFNDYLLIILISKF